MKLVEKQYRVDVDTQEEVRGFGIIDSAKMFRILSDGLYNDKVLAIIRELSANAYDSQVQNGNPEQPFDVHLPNWSNPIFWIRDYGVGMSDEKIDEVYRWYGNSDKDDSNNYVGCLGLGSKTPFCYHTRTFTVDSWHGGYHRVYNAFIGEDGKPKIVKASEERSDEPTGVKISLPAHSSDRHEFEISAEEAYTYYKVRPNFIDRAFSVNNVEYIIKTDKWGIRDNDHEGPQVVMGQVAYPVSYSDSKLTDIQKSVLDRNGSLDIFVDIGEVNIDASREGLSYDNRTKRLIQFRVNDVIKHIASLVQKEIDQSSNLWDARISLERKVKDKYLNRLLDASQVTYKGQPLYDDSTRVIKFKDLENVEIKTCMGRSWDKAKYRTTTSIRPQDKEYKFFINDLKTGSIVRLHHYADNHKHTICFLFTCTGEDKEEIVKRLGIDANTLEPISNIESPTVRTSHKRSKTTKVMEFVVSDLEYNSPLCSSWRESEVKLDEVTDEIVYVEFNRWRYRTDGFKEFQHPRELNSQLAYFAEVCVYIPNVVGVKTAVIDKIKNRSNWIPYDVWVRQKLTELSQQVDIDKIFAYNTQYSNISKFRYRHKYLSMSKIFDVSKQLNIDCLFVKFADGAKTAFEVSKEYYKAQKLLNLAKLFDFKIFRSKFSAEDLTALEKQVYCRYPLLGYLDDAPSQRISEYVKTIEGEN